MKAVYNYEGEVREKTGRGEARALRREGKVPAILYSKKLEPVHFTVSGKQLTQEYKKGGFMSKLVQIQVGGTTHYALARDLQLHPVTDQIEHADFLQVDADTRVPVKVAVKLLNMERCIGLRRGGAVNLVRHTIELICSPDSIPARIEVDMLNVNIGDSVHISSIKLPENVTPAITDRDFTVVTVTGRSSSKDEEAPAEAAPAAAAKAPAKG